MEDLAERLQTAGYYLICASPYRSGLARGAHMLATAILCRRRYDLAIVDLYSGKAFLWGEALAMLLTALRCPFAFVLRGGNLPDFARRWPKRVRSCLARASVVTAPSGYLLEEMRPYRNDIQLMPNPLNVSAYQFRLRPRPQPRLIWLRAFHEIYNPALAPRVVGLLAPDFPDVHLTMIGPDKGDGSWQRTEQTAVRVGVAGRISRPGGVPKVQIPACLEAGDIFLNTTKVDNTPVSVLEAMATGLCVVSTRVGGVPYLLEDGQDALLVPPDDAEAMALAIRRILTEPGLGERLSRNARAKAERFNWSAVWPQWQALLAEIIRGR